MSQGAGNFFNDLACLFPGYSWVLDFRDRSLYKIMASSCLCWEELPGGLEGYHKLIKVWETHWEHAHSSYVFAYRMNNLFVLCLFSFLPFPGNWNLGWQDEISTPKRTFADELLGNPHQDCCFLSEYKTSRCSNSTPKNAKKALSICIRKK